MSDHKQVKHEASTPAHQDADVPTIRKDKNIMRGPKGVDHKALIFVKAAANPKRPGSKAAKAFALYQDGMTVQDFIDAMLCAGLGGDATPTLVYDTTHGFIQIEGYAPAKTFAPKERKPRASKPKSVNPKKADAAHQAPAVEADVVEETIH